MWLDAYADSLKASIAFEAVTLVMSVVLLVCASLHQPKYKIMAIIWVVWSGICRGVALITVIVICVLAKDNLAVVLGVIAVYCVSTGVTILFILVVISYYQELRDSQHEYAGLIHQQKDADAPPAYTEKPVI